MKETYKKIFKLIKNYDEIVIARHIGPDPDAVASQIALRDSILLTFPEKKVYAVGAGVTKFKFLGNLNKVDFNGLTKVLLIALDVPNFARIDGIEELNYEKIVKIDHHPAEDIIGNADFTNNNYSSTAEMVSELIYNTKLQMNKEIAENLFLGIVSDSERFLFTNTTVNTLKMAAKLIEDYKIDFTVLYDNLYSKSFTECKFESYIIDNMTLTDNGLGYIVIDNEKVKDLGADSTMASVLVNNFNFIKELNVWCFVTYDERNEIYKVNIRSRGPIINEIANKYNGGGHAFASGARISKKNDVDKLIKELDEVAGEYLKKEEQ